MSAPPPTIPPRLPQRGTQAPRPLPRLDQAAGPDAADEAGARVPQRLASWPLASGLWLLTGGAVLLAAALALALAALWPGQVAVAAVLGAVAGTLALGLPTALLLLRVARDTGRDAPQPVQDKLAGTASRDQLRDLAGREFSRARRYGTGAAVLLVDVDRFNRLGESRGVDAGEAVLRELARQIAPTLRGADVLAREDGARLAVFLVQADPTGALDVAERIRERAEQLEVPWHPQRLRFTVSLGVAYLRPAHQSVQALFDDAEDAVMAAREAGGNCVRAAPVERRRSPAPGPAQGRDPRAQPGG
jgi:diguanylate cyclase